MTKCLDVNISETSYFLARDQIQVWSQLGGSRYICAANVHVVMQAHDFKEYNNALNRADMVTPDGMPLVWMLRIKGIKNQHRVYGPTLMLKILEMAAQEQIPVGFYGADAFTLRMLVTRMKERYIGLRVTYAFSPPFHPIDEQESTKIIEDITRSGTRILFVGLGCPKQELWMAEYHGHIPAVMIGVGAAFDFHAGVKKQAPYLLQKIGLEWLFRLIQEPQRLWRRYLYNNPRFVFLAILDLLGLYK